MYSPQRGFNDYAPMNVSLIDRVPNDMVHLIDPHWLIELMKISFSGYRIVKN